MAANTRPNRKNERAARAQCTKWATLITGNYNNNATIFTRPRRRTRNTHALKGPPRAGAFTRCPRSTTRACA
eukprot:11156913-Lingulodinium_polyedra.AAC.1